MSPDIRFEVTATTLSPLHVGDGKELREGFDFIEHRGHLWVANRHALMGAVLDEVAQEMQGQDLNQAVNVITEMTLDDLRQANRLRDEHFDLDKGLFRYRLRGSTSTKKKQGVLSTQIKDVYGRPYLPGSSLKGALRSALLRRLAAEDSREPVVWRKHRGRGFDPRFAARDMEKRHFVPARASKNMPNYDLWRAVRVFDSQAVPASNLALAEVLVFPTADRKKGRGGRLAFDIEAIPAGVTFHLVLSVDTWLFESDRAARLDFGSDHLRWFSASLCQMLTLEARDRLIEEVEFFKALRDKHEVRTTQRSLSRLADALNQLGDDEAMLAVGKGTGWRSKTLGRVLQERLSKREFDRLVEDFNLGRKLWRKDGRVPLTRQLATGGRQLRAPMGWLRLRLEPVGETRRYLVATPMEEEPEPPVELPSPEEEPKPPVEPPPPEKEPELPAEPPPPEEEPEMPPEPAPALSPGDYTGTVTVYYFDRGRGTVQLDEEQGEVEVRAEQLGRGVRYLAKGQRVKLALVQEGAEVRPQDVRPL